MRRSLHIVATAVEPLERRTFLDGELVAGWGAGGIIFLKAPAVAADVAPRPDGSVIVHATRGHDDSLYRLGTDGLIDPAYGGGQAGAPDGSDVAAESDDRVLYATPSGVDRYSAAGVLEQTFKGPKLNGTGGAALVEAFTRLPDGSFAIAGRNDVSAPTWSGIEWFNADGTHRASIDQAGDVVCLAGQADGKLLALLHASNGYALERYRSDGRLDSTFANDTPVVAPKGSVFSSVSVDAPGRIYVGGHLPVTDADYTGFAIARLLADGRADPAYGQGGLVTNQPFASVDFGTAMRVAPDGRMYVAATLSPQEEDRTIGVWRLAADGETDTTWGTNGATVVDVTYQTTSFSAPRADDLEFMPDGDVVVSGAGARAYRGNDQWRTAVVIRLNVEPAPAEIVVDDNGILTITGRGVADQIYVKTLANGRISATANGVTRTFRGIKGVLINAGGGNDYVDLSALAPLASATADVPVTVNGESGTDILVGSQGNDRLVGGNDNDRIAGLAGDDLLSGSAQSDRISGGTGDDSVSGNGGRDYLAGDDGNDTLRGGDQPDVLAGSNGDDSLLGEGGHDRLTGGPGIDTFSGGGGNDTFFANDRLPETITGGSGIDTAYADKDDLLISIEVPGLS